MFIASTIKCWVCHSDTDPKCADPFDNTTLPIKDCREVKKSHLFEGKFLLSFHFQSSHFISLSDEFLYDKLGRGSGDSGSAEHPRKLKTATMCRKIRQKIHGNWRTIRDCAFLGSPGEGTGNEHNCLYRRGTHDIYLEYCTCNSKDGCNSVPLKTHPSGQLVTLICSLVPLFLVHFLT